ncbi:hypothetical protein HDU96_000763 [Phlyctochytrium bullatum]|nr:hypothetical protein HDU96_000763 [Phlyctochytrium bullatum]
MSTVDDGAVEAAVNEVPVLVAAVEMLVVVVGDAEVLDVTELVGLREVTEFGTAVTTVSADDEMSTVDDGAVEAAVNEVPVLVAAVEMLVVVVGDAEVLDVTELVRLREVTEFGTAVTTVSADDEMSTVDDGAVEAAVNEVLVLVAAVEVSSDVVAAVEE